MVRGTTRFGLNKDGGNVGGLEGTVNGIKGVVFEVRC